MGRYLCHESCERTGNVYEVGGGWVAQARWQRSRGVLFDRESMSIESVANQIDEIEVGPFENETCRRAGAYQYACLGYGRRKELRR